ncbi:MAG: outer membrane lipoprotein-sorting protein [Candidatus Neomarinimicrobiota bacterium]
MKRESSRSNSVLFLLITAPLLLLGQTPSGTEILRRIDENTIAGNRTATSTMIIHGRRSSRTMTAKSWIQGTDQSFTEYLAPAREKGTKMLKLGDQLWMYSPQSDRIIRIAGHMLRQSMMGSDLSYEDMMEDRSLEDTYTAEVLGSEAIGDRDCWVLHLVAKVDDVNYHSRKIWVDQERLIGLKEDLFAKSGKLLKTTDVKEVFKIADRWYPKRMIFKDALSSGDGTEFIIESIEFDVDIPDYIFSKAVLKK